MEPMLVTGGTGTLGRVVVSGLLAAGKDVRVLSRRARTPVDNPVTSWTVGDLRRGAGLTEAFADVKVVVHCATSRGDVASARNLIDVARRSASPHLVYISIVGVDNVPFSYYRSKLQTERLIVGCGLPWSILRTTQFHDLILRACTALARLPVMAVPARTCFQPIEVREVAARLIEIADGPPAGRVPDMGGPEVLSARGLARSYLDASGRRRGVVSVRLPGAAAAGFRKGGHLTPDRAAGRVTFEDFLSQQSIGRT